MSQQQAIEAAALAVSLSRDQARERVYGMPYDEWKAQYQLEATPEQLARMQAAKSE